ncbi:MAG: tetratricopeptide repeat protein [Fluviicola sp.]
MSEWKKWSKHPYLVGVALFVITLIVFIPSLQYSWVNWDDPTYVLNNSLVTADTIQWQAIFETKQVLGIYHPITLISYAIDYQIWGTDPVGYHLTNVLFHTFNSVLVFIVFRKLNSHIFVAGTVALLFGIHPMHVESVSWISERKDVLYAFFLLLAWISYLRFRHSDTTRKWSWYILVLVLFCLSILSKPVAFVFPLIIILSDILLDGKINIKSLGNKVPIVLLALVAIVIAQWGQADSNSLNLSSSHPVPTLFYGSYNLVIYLIKAFIPFQLSVFHPFPLNDAMNSLFYLSLIPFIALLWLLYWSYRNSKQLFFGLSFFILTIAPLLQIIPFGKALTSERYTYLPYLGLFYVIGTGLQYLRNKGRIQPVAFWGIIIVFTALLTTQTINQQQHWKNGETLWSSSIEKYPEAYFPYLSRGRFYKEQKRLDLAWKDFRKSAALYSNVEAHYEIGLLYEEQKDIDEALKHYLYATKGATPYAKAHVNAGKIYGIRGDRKQAKYHFRKAIKIDPEYSLAYYNLALVHKMETKPKKALQVVNRAISLELENLKYIELRAAIQTDLGNHSAAIEDFEKVVSNQPRNAVAQYYLGLNYRFVGQMNKARAAIATSLQLNYPVPQSICTEFGLHLNE